MSGGAAHARRVTVLSIVVNLVLFLLKLAAGLAAHSLAVLADATNSLLDSVYSLGVWWSVGQSHKRADKGHPFGHARAEPMVAFVVAILMGIAAFEFLRSAIVGLFSPGAAPTLTGAVVAALVVAVAGKLFLSREAGAAGDRARSPALLATAADSRNDVLITLTALAGLVLAASGAPAFDRYAAIVIALFLFREAYRIGRRNVDYLLGAAPPKELEHRIRELASAVRGVRGIRLIRAHYVGSFVHVEVQIFVNPRITTAASHLIASSVQHDLELLPEVNKAFVHVEPA